MAVVSQSKWLTPALLVLAYAVAVFFYGAEYQLPGAVLADPFHDGEYFVYYLGRTMGAGPAQLNVHGGFEYLIPLFCAHVFGQAHYALPVWACYRAIDLVCACLAYVILRRMMRQAKWGELAAFSTFMAAPFLVGYRHGFLLLALFLWQCAAQEVLPKRRAALEILLGVVLAVGLFWSFNFGITAAMAIGLACCVRGLTDRYSLARVMGGGVVALAVLFGAGVVSVPHYVTNMIYAHSDSEYLKVPQSLGIVVLSDILLVAFMLAAALCVAVPRWAGLRKNALAGTVCFTVIGYWLYAYGSYHVDGGHFMAGMFGAILLVCFWYGRLYEGGFEVPAGSKRWSADAANLVRLLILVGLALLVNFAADAHVVPLLLPLFIIALALVLDPPEALLVPAFRVPGGVQAAVLGVCGAVVIAGYFVRAVTLPDYAWLGDLSHPPPNAALVPPAVRAVAYEMLGAGDRCVFDMSNSGLVDMVANLPPCTRFSYLIHAPTSYQDEMIADLAQERPPAVVYWSTVWSYNFDGISMKARYPLLDAYVRANYPGERCTADYCVRRLVAAGS